MFDFIRRPFLRRFGRDSVYYKIIDDVFGICPDNIELYKLALVHKSASLFLDDGRQINNERLEFLGDAVIETLRPIREEATRLLKDKAYLEGVYRDGAEKASYQAEKTLRKVYKKIGFLAR